MQVIHFEIGISVASHGPFVFPDNTQPISPIIWLYVLEEAVLLEKPFRLIVPHALIGLTKDKSQHYHIEFAKAVHRGYTAGVDSGNLKIKYQFISCDSKPLLASSGSKSYAVLESTTIAFKDM